MADPALKIRHVSRADMSETGAGVTELWWTMHGWASSLEEAEHIAEHGLDQHWGEYVEML